jgi:hypothetical protein
MAAMLLILHGLIAVALLGATTHQALAAWAPSSAQPHSFFSRFRAVHAAAFADAIVVLYVVSTLLGALVVYPYFKIDIQPDLERDRHWQALGLFDLKEDFVAIGLGLLPAFWISWRRPLLEERGQTRAALTALITFVVWWSFVIGHVVNDIRGFGS